MKKSTQSKAPREYPRLAPAFLEAVEDHEARAGSEGLPVGELVEPLLEDAIQRQVSDIHIEPQTQDTRVRFRLDGAIGEVARISHRCGKHLINQFKARAELDPIIRFTPRDAHASVSLKGARVDLRLALAPCQFGEVLAVRLLNARRLERTLDTLGLSEANFERIQHWMENVNGMFLAAGPTGSGKTTTIYSLLHILKHRDLSILSLEDPVEYAIDGVTQIQIDSLHHLTFAEGIKSLLRLDPDMIALGEIRDSASAHSAVNAAISGRVLLSTIHSKDAVGALTSLRNWGLANHEIAESVMVVVAQRLVRRLCPDCREKEVLGERDARWFKAVGLRPPRSAWFARGCNACNGVGYRDRTGLFELWKLERGDYDLILKHADEYSIRRQLGQRNHSSLLEDGLEKIKQGTTSIEEVRRARSA